ncbi:MAG TPA: response regulator transcription factor [Acidimicrobiales bacterium]|jgi:DNA-binding NarL/FixJ family response regulator
MSRTRLITVVIADDDAYLRDLLRLRLDLDGRFDVVGEAFDGMHAVDVLRTHRPDAVILDVGMPRMTGIEVLSQIRHELPDTKVVLFTSLRDPALREAAELDGADAYLEKGDIMGSLIPTIVELVGGD